MLPGKRDLYRCCKARRSASHVNKEFWQQFQNYAPPSLRVIRTKFARIIIGERAKRARHSQVCSIENRGYIYILEKWFPLWGERAHSLKLFCMYDKRFEIKNKIEWRKQNHRRNNLPKAKIFSTLQLHHLILAFITHNQIIFVYIHKYIHALYIMNCSKK